MELKEFSDRLARLRIDKDVSARDMSLSIGQSPSYINNIENGLSFPSMTGFFYICEYLDITPQEFFDTGTTAQVKVRELVDTVKGLTSLQLEHLIAIAKDIKG